MGEYGSVRCKHHSILCWGLSIHGCRYHCWGGEYHGPNPCGYQGTSINTFREMHFKIKLFNPCMLRSMFGDFNKIK